jgi:hypothetical protein
MSNTPLLVAVSGAPCPYCGQTMQIPIGRPAATTSKPGTLAPSMWQRSLSVI